MREAAVRIPQTVLMSLKAITRMKTGIIRKMTATAMSLMENMMDGIPDTQMKVITIAIHGE